MSAVRPAMSAVRAAFASLTAGQRWTASLAVALGVTVLLFGMPATAPRLAPVSRSVPPPRAVQGGGAVDYDAPPTTALGVTPPLRYFDENVSPSEEATTSTTTTISTTTTTSTTAPPCAVPIDPLCAVPVP